MYILRFTVWFFLLVAAIAAPAVAQTNRVDSFEKLLKTQRDPHQQIILHNSLAKLKLTADLSRSQYHARTALNIARSQSIKTIQVGESWLLLGNCYYVQGNYDSAGYAYRQGIPFSESDPAGYQNLPTIYSNIGLIAINQAHYSEGLSWQFKALAIYDSLKQVRGVLRCYNAIAVVYSESGELTRNPDDYANALLYLRKCLTLSNQTDDSLGINNVLINIGSVYQRSGSNDSALWYFREAARRAERQKDKLSYSNAVANIAECSQLMGLDEEAEKFALIGLKLKTDEGDQLGVCTINFILGKLYEKRGQKEKSRTAYQESYKIAKLIGANREQSESARRLAELYAGEGNYTQAWLFIGDYVKLNDSISSQQSIQLIQELKARFDDENQKKQIALLTQEKQIAELAATRQRYIIGFSIAGSLLLFLLAALIYRSLRASRRSRLKLQEAFVIIQEKNKSITDSIHYARHLQDAILPEEETIQRLLPNSFWFYKPKDIVAGDFYWIQKLNDLIFFAVADCTGHGVPGAMVSVVCSKALNTALLEMHITEPGAILDAATDIVVSTFARTKSELSDGMDISLCVWNTKTRTLQWAGANNPLFIVSAAEVQLIKADKQPVGKSHKRNTFTTHTFQFEQPVKLYLFTDGFADQFGGADGKKFKQKQLTEILTALAELPAAEQQRRLGETLTDWQGTLDQIDDVLVAGIKL